MSYIWNHTVCNLFRLASFIWQYAFKVLSCLFRASQMALVVKNSPANARDVGSIPGSGRSPVESESEVAQSCPTLCDPMDCSLPGSSVHGIFQASVLEWIAISFSRGSSQPRDWTQVSRTVDRCFTIWATRAWQSTPVFLPGEFHGQRSLLGYIP